MERLGEWQRRARERIKGARRQFGVRQGNWRRRSRERIKGVQRWIEKWADLQVGLAFVAALLGLLFMRFAARWYEDWEDFWQGVYVEGAGAVMDLVVFGIIIAIMVRLRERKREISNQLELIDDFKKWDSDEGRFRIAGAVRRLNRLGRTSIDFVGLEMSEFSFRSQDIRSIAGSKFYLGQWYPPSSHVKALLRNVDFSHVDCSNVIFSANQLLGRSWPAERRSARLLDCRFGDANLCGAIFNGALMKWTEAPPEETGEWMELEDGDRDWVRTYQPPFWRADLKGASFVNVAFRNADFREAENIEECSFAGATGLDDCIFDSEEVKQLVLRSAQSP